VRSATGRPSGSFSATLGGTDPLRGHDVAYSFFGTYQYAQEVKAEHVRAQASAQSGAEAEVADRFVGETGGSSVLWGGLADLSTAWGAHSRFQLNGVYNRTADDEARLEEGDSENLGQRFEIQRLRYVERACTRSSSPASTSSDDAQRLDWSGTRSGVTRARARPLRDRVARARRAGQSPAPLVQRLQRGRGAHLRRPGGARLEGSLGYTLIVRRAAGGA
jgi:hypothetical protein